MRIKGKNAVVTGAANGIGRATALMLAQKGIGKIAIIDIERDGLDSLANQIREVGALPFCYEADLGDPHGVAALFDRVAAEMGGLDIVHNNAGVTSGGDFPETPLERMISVIEINLLGMIAGTTGAIAVMRGQESGGVIINTASTVALGTLPADPAYAASKHGILAFSQSCKPLHETYGIRVMTNCPGMTDTAMVPRHAEWLQPMLNSVEILDPAEIASEVCRIVEDDSLSGDYVVIDNRFIPS